MPQFARADGGGGRAMTLAHDLDRRILIQYELFAGGVDAMQGYTGRQAVTVTRPMEKLHQSNAGDRISG